MSPVAKQLAPTFLDGWGTMQLRHASTCLDGRRVPLNVEQRSRRQGEYPYWGANGVVDSIDEYLFDEPLVLIGEDGAPFFDSTRPVAFFVTGKIWVNNHIHVLRIGRNFDPRFVTHCLNATDYGPYIEGSTRDKLTQEKMGSIRLPSPPLPQQRAIADYLDRETARLDALVAETARSITLLKERRDALVSAAVTGQINVEQAVGSGDHALVGGDRRGSEEGRGRDRAVAKGGDGVTTDASRNRVRLKYRAHIEMGQSPPSTDYSSSPEDGLPFLQGTAEFGATSPTPRVYCGSPTKLASAGDILFSVRAPVGEINLADQEFGIGRGLCAIRPQQHWNARFAWWALHEARHQLNFVSTGSTYEAVATEDVGNLLVETTTPDAQRAIADYLDRETARLDSLLVAKERSIGLLKERRAALISAAVTGQIDMEQVAWKSLR